MIHIIFFSKYSSNQLCCFLKSYLLIIVLKINFKTVVGKYGFKFTLNPQLTNAFLRLIFKTVFGKRDFKK